MPTISYNPGDVLLLRMPVGEDGQCHARPVMVARESKPGENNIFVVPLTHDPINDCNTIMIGMGTYEFARMGLVTAAYLNALPPIETPANLVLHRIGKDRIEPEIGGDRVERSERAPRRGEHLAHERTTFEELDLGVTAGGDTLVERHRRVLGPPRIARERSPCVLFDMRDEAVTPHAPRIHWAR